jgi:hypothetical protein
VPGLTAGVLGCVWRLLTGGGGVLRVGAALRHAPRRVQHLMMMMMMMMMMMVMMMMMMVMMMMMMMMMMMIVKDHCEDSG